MDILTTAQISQTQKTRNRETSRGQPLRGRSLIFDPAQNEDQRILMPRLPLNLHRLNQQLDQCENRGTSSRSFEKEHEHRHMYIGIDSTNQSSRNQFLKEPKI